jgi:hypothetical protein
MKAILLAAASGLVLILIATALFRSLYIARRARALLLVFLACLALLITLHLLTPDDLGLLPTALLAPRWVDLLFSNFLLTAGFLGGVLQIYNLADRGLSLRMLIDILQSPSGKANAAEVATIYGSGQGVDWMYEKRLQGLSASGLISDDGTTLELTRKGARVADLFVALHRYCRLTGEVQP